MCPPSLLLRWSRRPNVFSHSARKKRFALASKGWGREKTGGRGGKKSKQMMVPGKRFPPLGGNSLWPDHNPPPPQPSSISHILYKGINHQSATAKLMLYQAISLVSETYPSRLKQQSSIRAVRWYWDWNRLRSTQDRGSRCCSAVFPCLHIVRGCHMFHMFSNRLPYTAHQQYECRISPVFWAI